MWLVYSDATMFTRYPGLGSCRSQGGEEMKGWEGRRAKAMSLGGQGWENPMLRKEFVRAVWDGKEKEKTNPQLLIPEYFYHLSKKCYIFQHLLTSILWFLLLCVACVWIFQF